MIRAETGTVAATYEYSPYGELLSSTGTFASLNPFRFSTKYTDTETGLSYFGYRYYNPETGRWLNRDPLGEWGGSNLYAYVGNEPMMYVDPFGADRYMIYEGHVGLGVDVWEKVNGRYVVVGQVRYDFSVNWENPFFLLGIAAFEGKVIKSPASQNEGLISRRIPSNYVQDRLLLSLLEQQIGNPPWYSALLYNCIHWADEHKFDGMYEGKGKKDGCGDFRGGGSDGSW